MGAVTSNLQKPETGWRVDEKGYRFCVLHYFRTRRDAIAFWEEIDPDCRGLYCIDGPMPVCGKPNHPGLSRVDVLKPGYTRADEIQSNYDRAQTYWQYRA